VATLISKIYPIRCMKSEAPRPAQAAVSRAGGHASLALEATPSHSILELQGLGKELWEGIDPAAHVEAERASWG